VNFEFGGGRKEAVPFEDAEDEVARVEVEFRVGEGRDVAEGVSERAVWEEVLAEGLRLLFGGTREKVGD